MRIVAAAVLIIVAIQQSSDARQGAPTIRVDVQLREIVAFPEIVL